MSVTDYRFFDPSTGLTAGTRAINPNPLTLLGPYNFSFASTGLTAGVPLVTLPVGAVIYDIGVSVPVAFNGTTPMADVGTFGGGTAGLFDEIGGATIDLTGADTAVTDNAGLSTPANANWLSGGSGATPELYVTTVSTLLLVVSQDGTQGGTATGATAGVGAVYVLAATPYLF